MSTPSEWELLARYLSGEYSEEEQAPVETLIALDPEKQRLIASMSKVWDSPEAHSGVSDVSRLWGEIEVPRHRRRQGMAGRAIGWLQPPVRHYTAAAALLVSCSLAYYGSQEMASTPDGHADAWATVVVESGTHGSLTLSDGSRVRLDAGSTLRYPEAFGEHERTVFLNGEGYFEVASNAGKRFVVHAEHAVVEVLGTQFNVRAWQPEQRGSVVVAEGKVALHSDGQAQEAVEIIPGQMSTLPQDGPPAVPRPVDVDQYLGWMQREAFFDNAPLHEILYQLERWYDVDFTLEDDSMATEQLTIYVSAQPLEDVLELISALTNLEYQRSEGSVRLKPRVP